jgi:homoserine O-acetyltransferase
MAKEQIVIDQYELESGVVIKNVAIAFHRYGNFDEHKNNVIWICHALTANSDPYEWWPKVSGSDGYFNENDHHIICANILGSCYGTTGPLSEDENGQIYYDEFPQITTRDMAGLHELLAQRLGITQIQTLIGASLGGQQAIEWAISNPNRFEHLILIATNAYHSPYGIAFNESQRLAIEADPSYYLKTADGGKNGLIAARSIALLSYRSYAGYLATQRESVTEKTNQFRAAQYQRYQGTKLANRFNAYSYVLLSKAMDSHNVARGRESLAQALKTITAKTLIIGITSDILFPLEEQKLLKFYINYAEFQTIDSSFGHDGFLLEHESLTKHFKNFFEHKDNRQWKKSFQNEFLFTA